MSEWSAGYMAEIDYTYGYYAELNPARAKLALLQAGLHAPEVAHACELGFGQGVSVNIHAATGGTQWAGTDFNPAHACFAQELAQFAGHGADLQEQAFEAFCQRSDLPDFDFIGMHGIWSWVSDANRAILVDFLARKLKPGGVLYVSYNTQPGWAAMAPMRELLALHAQTMSAPGAGVLSRVNNALSFAQQLLDAKPVYALLNSGVADRIKTLQTQDRNYLAHEYFNDHWQPMGFSSMARWLGGAKLQWACSAHYIDSLDAINLTAEQSALLAAIPDVNFRQSVGDFCVNRQFRKDYWVKGVRELGAAERLQRWRRQGFVLVKLREEIDLELTGRQARMNCNAALYAPLLEQLADHEVHTGEQLEQALQPHGIPFDELRHMLWMLCVIDAVHPAQEAGVTEQARACADRLNACLLERASDASAVSCLASPVTGGGVGITPFQQLFLRARQSGMTQAAEWGQHAWCTLQALGQCVVKDGEALRDPAANLAELQSQAEDFAARVLPMLRALRVAP